MLTSITRTLRHFLAGKSEVSVGPDAAPAPTISYADISEMPDPQLAPPLLQADVDELTLTPDQLSWRRNGVTILRNFLPDEMVDAYVARRSQVVSPNGSASPTPFLQVEELRALALYPPLMAIMRDIVGESMMLHLSLTGWVSTEREWHQDDYLNPSFVNGWYAAAWMALDEIDPDAGPFEYVPGSHL